MKDLTLYSNQVEVSNFQTFTTEYVANRYNVSEITINSHKSRHADEIANNIHFVYKDVATLGGTQKKLFWTLKGIIKLGFFIRSEEAKHFRLWAEAELEKSINKELENAKQSKALLAKQAQHHQNVINGYKSQIIQHNAQIVELKAKQEQELKQKQTKSKDDEIVLYLNAIQKELEANFNKMYAKIGAVMSYANSGDRFFLDYHFHKSN